MKTFVKLTGVTTPDEVRQVPAGGAAGFITGTPGAPGSLDLASIAPLVEALDKEAEAWAVVRDPSADQIHQLFDEVGVDRIQVYGKVPEGLEFLEIHHIVPSLPIPAEGTEGAEPTVPPAEDYSRLHLDVAGDPLAHACRERPDWAMCARIVEAQPGRKLVLAGGLTASTVAEALSAVRPWGLDLHVCGLEGGASAVAAALAAIEAAERPPA